MSFQAAIKTGIAATFLLSTTAYAATVSTATVTTATQLNNNPPVVNVDTDTVTDGTASATSGLSNAVQNADGTSEVNATVGVFGGFGSTRIESEARLDFSETNNTQGTRTYFLDFTLSGLSTEISTTRSYGANLTNPFDNPDPGFVDVDSAYTAASFEYSIQINGVDIYTARADVLGLPEFLPPNFDLVQLFQFDNVQNFVPSIASIGGGFVETFLFSVADLSGTIELGNFNAGESFDVTSKLTARAFATNFEGENVVGAFVQDPITISSFGFRSAPAIQPPDPNNPGVIPLPAAGWLLLGALGGLAALKRRKPA